MEQKEFRCSGDCLNCRKQPSERREQWQYCAAQFTYNSMLMVESMQETIKTMNGTVEELKAKLEAIQNNEANVFYPIVTEDNGTSEIPTDHPIAQEGVGA